ncbi:MAG: SNF2-related protein, partial [Thermoanaerobaculia bacterium]
MTIASTLERFVSSKVRKRGIHYFRGKRVRLTVGGPETAEAVVSGSSEYDVLLSRGPDGLRVSCSCPVSGRGEPCKHVWAVILEADARGYLQGEDGAKIQKVTVAPVPEGRRSAPRKLPAARKPARTAPPRVPAWSEALRKVEGPAPPPLPVMEKELLYLLDLQSTLKSQQITLDVITSQRKRDGSWSRQVSRPYLSREHIPALRDPADRKILSLIAGASPYNPWQWHMHGASSTLPSPCALPPETADVLLPLLCSTGRFRLRLGPDLLEGETLTWDHGEPWELWLKVHEETGGDCRVKAELRRGEQRLEPGKPALALHSGYLIAGSQVSRLVSGGSFRWTPLLPPAQPLQVPAAERDDFLERLLALPSLPRLDLPPSMRFEEVHAEPRPRLRLFPPHGPNAWPRAELSFLYDGVPVTPGAPGRGSYLREQRRFLLRGLETEQRGLDRLRELGFKPDRYAPAGKPQFQVPAGRIPKAVPALLAEGWSVEMDGKLYRSAGRFKMAVASGIDWFELSGEADFDGQTVPLPALLAALSRGEKFIPLSDGSLGLIPSEWSRKFAPVAGLGEESGDHLRFRTVQAALLDAWLADEPVSCDAMFERARERLRGFAGIEPTDAPPGFQGELRPYQRAGLGWIHFLRDFGFGGCLADDMGLGKTVQVLALLLLMKARGLGPTLLVAPASLIANWRAEAARFAPGLRVAVAHASAHPSERGDIQAADLVITSYGSLRRRGGILRRRWRL